MAAPRRRRGAGRLASELASWLFRGRIISFVCFVFNEYVTWLLLLVIKGD